MYVCVCVCQIHLQTSFCCFVDFTLSFLFDSALKLFSFVMHFNNRGFWNPLLALTDTELMLLQSNAALLQPKICFFAFKKKE